jgi:hypothetical protein
LVVLLANKRGEDRRQKTEDRRGEDRRQKSGVQEFRSSGVQEFRSSGVQEVRNPDPNGGLRILRRQNLRTPNAKRQTPNPKLRTPNPH